MSKAYDVMTKTLATTSPYESAANVAKIMRDRNIGDVLIVEDGQLRGIVTDRDLALQALADSSEAQTPISKYMNPKVVTGSSAWNLNKVAKTMARHQIRRLPILEEGNLIGIVSLGDLAQQSHHRDTVGRLLKDISQPTTSRETRKNRHLGSWLGLSLAALSTTMLAWLTWSHSGQQVRKQVSQSQPYHSATQAVNSARERVTEITSSKAARNLQKQVRSSLKDISQQLPSIEYKRPRRKMAWFR